MLRGLSLFRVRVKEIKLVRKVRVLARSVRVRVLGSRGPFYRPVRVQVMVKDLECTREQIQLV